MNRLGITLPCIHYLQPPLHIRTSQVSRLGELPFRLARMTRPWFKAQELPAERLGSPRAVEVEEHCMLWR